MLAITGIDVGFVGAIGGVLGVVVAPAVTIWVGRQTRRHERGLHIYDDERRAYVTFLEDMYRKRERLRRFVRNIQSGGSSAAASKPADGQPDFPKILAVTMPFFSDQLMSLVGATGTAWEEARLLLASDAPELAALTAAEKSFSAAVENVRQAIHAELFGDERPKLRRQPPRHDRMHRKPPVDDRPSA